MQTLSVLMAYFMARGLTLLAEGPEAHEGAFDGIEFVGLSMDQLGRFAELLRKVKSAYSWVQRRSFPVSISPEPCCATNQGSTSPPTLSRSPRFVPRFRVWIMYVSHVFRLRTER